MQIVNTNLRVVIEDKLDYMSLQQVPAIVLECSMLKGMSLQ